MGSWRRRLWGLGVGSLFWVVLASSTMSQVPQVAPGRIARPAPANEESSAAGQSVFVPADRTALMRLADARQLLQQERYAEAVRLLGTILEGSEDYFFQPDPSSAVHRSLKNEAQRLLGGIPRQGRELYELQYGARARQLLSEAVKGGSTAALAEVARLFFHTQAGYEATFLLGLQHLDHGSPLAGAMTLRRLQEAPTESARFEPTLSLAIATCWLRIGMPDKARQVLAQLKQRYPQATIQVAGKQTLLFAGTADNLDGLVALLGPQQAGSSQKADQWPMFRGNAARNAASAGSGPLLSLCWQVPTYEHPSVQALIEQIEQLHREREPGFESLPGLHPLAVNDVVLMRTVRNLLAVDFVTGKRIWEVPVEDVLDNSKLSADGAQNEPGMAIDRFGRQPQDLEAHIGLQLRLWGDATYGTLSSDGQFVFAIEDLDLAVGDSAARRLNGADANNPSSPRPYNRLAAYDIRTGKLKWHIGGSSTEFDLPEAGMFFLGPPLPLMGELYVLGESKGEIRLLALSAKNGTLNWTQQLAVVDRDIASDPMRRLTGASPSYADGILICPTANRSIVAMDLSTRSLLWGYTYNGDFQAEQRQLMVFGVRSLMNSDPAGRWSDATATIAEGSVLVTPPDSNQIHCLSLIDGRLLWSQSRQNDLYLACVEHGKVVLVGRDRVRALRLDNGQSAWDSSTTSFPEGSSPSGRGFTSGDRYYIPLSSAEVVAVALESGRIAHTFKARNGTVPGNLICHKGHILSQRADGVEKFYQLDALRAEVDKRLKAKADDAEALALQGQILWDDGLLHQAVESLRRAWELTHDPRTRNLLRDALMEGLRTRFVDYRQREDEILRLIDQPSQRATYLRLMANGYVTAQQFDQALEYYLKLVDLDREYRDMEVVDKSLTVRRDRWLQVQMAALREKAPADVQAKLDRVSQTRLEEAAKTQSSDALHQYLDYFGSLPVARHAQRYLLDQLKSNGRLLEAELLLTRQEHGTDRPAAATAVAELAQLLRDAGRLQDAAVCYGRLKAEFAEVVCRDGKTGRDLVASLPADDPVGQLLKPAVVWPVGKVRVDVDNRPSGSPHMAFSRSSLEYFGSPSPFFADVDIEAQQNPAGLIARDGVGRPLWELSGGELTDQMNFMVSAAFMRVAVQGHLMLVTMGQRIIAIDTLAAKKTGSPRILWSRNLEDEGGSEPAMPIAIRTQPAPGFGGLQRLQMARSADNSQNVPAAVSEQTFCYQRFHDLVALEPSTGATLWVRHGVEPGNNVFGDRHYIIIAAPGQGTATILRAVDGSLVGTRPLPLQRVATFGRFVLVVQDSSEARELHLIDPVDSSKIWPVKRFAVDTRLCLVDQEAVAALEPDGHFVVIRLADGRTIINTRLQMEAKVEEIHVLQSPDGDMLIANSGETEDGTVQRTYPLQLGNSVRIIRGWLWGFDSAGALLWPEPVRIKNQQLPLSQPRRLPVLVFACPTQERRPNSPIQTKTSLLFVDKRTGRTSTKELLYGTNPLQLIGTPEKKIVELQLQRNKITLTFTDQPLGPNEPEQATGIRVPGTAGAIWRALGSGASKALGPALKSVGPLDASRGAKKLGEAVRAADRTEVKKAAADARQAQEKANKSNSKPRPSEEE